MFIIVKNGFVILGPMKWNRFRFQNVIKEECEIDVVLPDRNDNNQVITCNEDIKIFPVQNGPDVEYNPKIQMLNGPFWEFTETHAISSYQVLDLSIDTVKGMLKSKLANERWKKETSGIKITIQNIEVTVDTNRGDRDIFIQKFLLMNDADTVIWKFPETWISLTKSDLNLIVTLGATHVQQSFEWEATLSIQIDNCTTLSELDTIVIEEQSI